MSPNRRRFRIIRPRLQLRLIAAFLGLAVLALVFQHLLFVRVLATTSLEAGSDGIVLLDHVDLQLLMVLLEAFLVLLPMTLLVGVLVTHRLAGPVHRLESHLRDVLAGGTAEECRLRRGDELQDLCGLINVATARLRAENAAVRDSRASDAKSAA